MLDPVIFKKEIEAVKALGFDLEPRLLVSRKAHLIMPTHRILDAASEAAKGKTKIGSTLKGIGPTYMDKTGRNGMRVGDIELPDFKEKYDFLTNKHLQILKQYNFEFDLKEFEKGWMDGIESIRSFNLVNGEYAINQFLAEGKSVLAEGAQGSMLDVDFGSYPYVTSSNTICAGACTGLGLSPQKIGRVIGAFESFSEKSKIPIPIAMRFNLVFDDLLNNIVSYAFPEGGKHEIRIHAEKSDNNILLTVEDDGIPFNPFAQTEADTSLSLEDREIGGLGIHLIKNIMDEVSYRRQKNHNVVTLIMKLEG